MEWICQNPGEHWATAPDGRTYMVTSYHFGTLIELTCHDAAGNGMLLKHVPTIDAGKADAERHLAAAP